MYIESQSIRYRSRRSGDLAGFSSRQRARDARDSFIVSVGCLKLTVSFLTYAVCCLSACSLCIVIVVLIVCVVCLNKLLFLYATARARTRTSTLGCRQIGSTLMGPLQKQGIVTDWEKRYTLSLLGR